MNFKVFSDSKQLLEFAAKFIIDERISCLKKDVSSCLGKDCAFPALLYCFSTVDLLGALCTGYARRSSHSEANFKYYLSHFMKRNNFSYNGEPVELLQEIFRHKIVHLAYLPKLVVNSKGRDIMWSYEYPNVTNHLKIESVGHVKQIKKTC